jgi:uncharacterized protein with FMN-binding domain
MSDSLKKNRSSQSVERILGLVALILLGLFWYIGGLAAKSDYLPALTRLIPKAQQFQSLGQNTYAAWADRDGSNLLGYVKIARAMGYGGPITVAVAADPKGKIMGLGVVDHKDTPSYYERVIQSGFLSKLVGKGYKDQFTGEKGVDTISGATRTSNGILSSTELAVREIAGRQLGLSVPGAKDAGVSFGPADIVLISLFALGIVARRKYFKRTQLVRWISLLTGLVVLGFIYNNPLTIAMFNQVLLGYWPDWHTNLYTYLLVGGVVLLFFVEGKNPYCLWICPFGAAQECLGKLTRAKTRQAGRFRGFLKWLQRGVAFVAISMALLLRDPGLTSYEVFGTLFKMWGSAFQFLVIALVFLFSLYTFRPWCNYLCPVKPVEEFARMIRKWVKDVTWKKKES